jgi:hypothetical protein
MKLQILVHYKSPIEKCTNKAMKYKIAQQPLLLGKARKKSLLVYIKIDKTLISFIHWKLFISSEVNRPCRKKTIILVCKNGYCKVAFAQE